MKGAGRDLGPVHDPHVIGAVVGDDLQLLLASEEPLVHHAGTLGFTLKHRVADVLAVEIHRLRASAPLAALLRLRSSASADS